MSRENCDRMQENCKNSNLDLGVQGDEVFAL